jgi:hypothetical protein
LALRDSLFFLFHQGAAAIKAIRADKPLPALDERPDFLPTPAAQRTSWIAASPHPYASQPPAEQIDRDDQGA